MRVRFIIEGIRKTLNVDESFLFRIVKSVSKIFKSNQNLIFGHWVCPVSNLISTLISLNKRNFLLKLIILESLIVDQTLLIFKRKKILNRLVYDNLL